MNLPFDLEMAARTVWMEARGEGVPGMQAVAWVIVNRFKSNKWFAGQTLTACVLMPSQFSCWNTNDKNRGEMAKLGDQDLTLMDARRCVNRALSGLYADPTFGATHYLALGIIGNLVPGWVKGATKTGQIGNHTFYTNVA